MLAALILLTAIAVSPMPPTQAWEPLACTYCSIDGARASGWSFEAATAETGGSAWASYIVPDVVRGQRFATQGDCLAALRRALPVVTNQADTNGQVTNRHHRRDHISEAQGIPGVQSGSALYGCFQHQNAIS